MKKSKLGQITIFVIVAVIIVASIISLVYLSKNRANVINQEQISELDVPQATENIKIERDNCLRKLTIEGLDLYGLDQEAASRPLRTRPA